MNKFVLLTSSPGRRYISGAVDSGDSSPGAAIHRAAVVPAFIAVETTGRALEENSN